MNEAFEFVSFVQIGQLKLLRALCAERDPDTALEVRKLAMSAFTAVMKDISPRLLLLMPLLLNTLCFITLPQLPHPGTDRC